MVQMAHFGISCPQGPDTEIRNVKIVGGWQFTTDGVNAPSVRESWKTVSLKCNDDAIKLNFSDSRSCGATWIWRMENGADTK